MATIMSTPPRRPSQLLVDAHLVPGGQALDVGGKMLRGLTGTPMRRMALANSSLAEAEPEPLTLANLTTKSLRRRWAASRRLLRRRAAAAAFRGPAWVICLQDLLHVPGAGGQRSAHRPQCRQTSSSFTITRWSSGRGPYRSWARFRAGAFWRWRSSASLAVGGEADAVHRADVHAGVALDAQAVAEHGLHVAVQAALRLRCRPASKPSSTSTLMRPAPWPPVGGAPEARSS